MDPNELRLEGVVIVAAGVTGPDADAAPETVTTEQIMTLQRVQNFGDVPGKTLILALDAPETETVTVSLWHRGGPLNEPATVFPAAHGSRYFRFATALVVTGNRLQNVPCFVGGDIYVQVTADSIAGGQRRRLRGSCVA